MHFSFLLIWIAPTRSLTWDEKICNIENEWRSLSSFPAFPSFSHKTSARDVNVRLLQQHLVGGSSGSSLCVVQLLCSNCVTLVCCLRVADRHDSIISYSRWPVHRGTAGAGNGRRSVWQILELFGSLFPFLSISWLSETSQRGEIKINLFWLFLTWEMLWRQTTWKISEKNSR